MKITCDCAQCELKNAFFNSLNDTEVERFCTQKVETKFARGDVITREGDEIKDFSYLKSGLVKLYKTTTDGKDQIITIAEPFDFVSLLSVFSDTRYNYSVSAIEDSVICSLDLGVVREQAKTNSSLSLNLIEKMSMTTDKIILESLAIRKRNLHGKVAYILLKFGKEIYKSEVFEIPVSRREIAEYIGMTTENVIRTFSEFRKDRLIRINGKEIEILDPKGLEQISNFG